jgi:hypothetical protein
MSQGQNVPVNNLLLDRDVYRKITMLAYRQNTNINSVINSMLKEYIDLERFLRTGYVMINKKTLRTAFGRLAESDILDAAGQISDIVKEMLILMGKKPSFESYIELVRLFTKTNGYELEIGSKDSTYSIVMGHNMGRGYSLYISECLKSLFGPISSINNVELSDSVIYFECKESKELAPNVPQS